MVINLVTHAWGLTEMSPPTLRSGMPLSMHDQPCMQNFKYRPFVDPKKCLQKLCY